MTDEPTLKEPTAMQWREGALAIRRIAEEWERKATQLEASLAGAAPAPDPDVHHYSRGHPIGNVEHEWDQATPPGGAAR